MRRRSSVPIRAKLFFEPFELHLQFADLGVELLLPLFAASASGSACLVKTSGSRSATSFFHWLTCVGCTWRCAAITWTGWISFSAALC